MIPYRLLSALLTYPEQALLDALPDIDTALTRHEATREALTPLLTHLRNQPLIPLQETYVATFDRNPAHALHLFEHVHGESRARGQALVDLLHTYRAQGYSPIAQELPDHVPLFLEFLGVIPPETAQSLLEDALPVLAALGARLAQQNSPYASVFTALGEPSRTLAATPQHDMAQTLARQDCAPDGAEPLLQPGCVRDTQPIRIHPRGVAAPENAP